MDLSELSGENFDPIAWINQKYDKYIEENGGAATEELKYAFVSSYMDKLEISFQEVNATLEESRQQVVESMPRIINESLLLQADVQLLQSQMEEARKEMEARQAESGDCMAELERLNNLQKELKAAKESLLESDGWGNLLVEVEDAFERNELQNVCEKLLALQKSLFAQEKLPGHADRQTQVEDFKNRLEALASPSIVQAFAEANPEQAQRFVRIFNSLERLPQLQQYYRAVQKNSLQQRWKETLELGENNSSTQFLTLFYDELLENCHKQHKWCLQLFSDVADEQTAAVQPFLVIGELLPALQPTRDQHVLQLLRASNERLELLECCAQANENFVKQLNAFLAQSSVKLPEDILLKLCESIYEYFFKFIQQYASLEETQLSTQVDRLLQHQASAGEAVRHLEDCVRKLFDWLSEASERCANVTHNLALCRFIALVGGILKRLLDNCAKTQRQLELAVGSGDNSVEGAAVATENWSLLQNCMSLLQCLADFQLRLRKYEKYLHGQLNKLAERLNAKPQSQQLCIYRVYDHQELKRITASIQEYNQRRIEATQMQLHSLGIFTQIYDALHLHLEETHEVALNILLRPIEVQLQSVAATPSDSELDATGGSLAEDLPAFSFTPQEYITQVGQYLLTLPQHLEPLLLAPSPRLKQALELCNGKYVQPMPCAAVLLALVTEQCCAAYQMRILQLKSLSSTAAKQLAVDIEYLASVLEELGLSLSQHLGQLPTLLCAAPDAYLTLSSGCEPRLVTAIRQMRNIISKQ